MKPTTKRIFSAGQHPVRDPDIIVGILEAAKKQRQREKQDFEQRVSEALAIRKAQEFNSGGKDFIEPSPAVFDALFKSNDPHHNGIDKDISDIPPMTAEELLARIKETPRLPTGTHRPKQSLGQNYLIDANTVANIIRAFHADAMIGRTTQSVGPVVELGPGIGALTNPLYQIYGGSNFQCIEIDERSIAILQERHPGLRIHHDSVLSTDYRVMSLKAGEPLTVIGNLPYNITTKILFTLADAAANHNAIRSATVTLQLEAGERVMARTKCGEYGILSVILQLYTSHIRCHFQIPPTVYYPRPKVQSGLYGIHFLEPNDLKRRLAGVRPWQVRKVLDLTFQHRRKMLRKSLRTVYHQVYPNDKEYDRLQAAIDAPTPSLPNVVQQSVDSGDLFSQKQKLPDDWSTKRPEELSPGQFIELTRLVYGVQEV